MNKIELNHWYIHDNELSISLMNFYVVIKRINSSSSIYYQLRVKDKNEMYLNIHCYSLEDAVLFTEKEINKCNNFQEIINKYREIHNKKKYKNLYEFSKSNDNNHIIKLTPQEVDEAIIDFYGKGKTYRISVKDEVLYKDGNLLIKMMLIKHLEKKEQELLTYDQIKQAINEYIGKDEYEVISFNYNIAIDGCINTPLYYGIDLNVNKKNKKVLKKDK